MRKNERSSEMTEEMRMAMDMAIAMVDSVRCSVVQRDAARCDAARGTVLHCTEYIVGIPTDATAVSHYR